MLRVGGEAVPHALTRCGVIVKIESTLFGPQICEPETNIVFPQGIPGFEKHKAYQLFHQTSADVVGYLQSTDDPDLTFSVLAPENLNIHYEFTLTDEEQSLLQLERVEDLVLLVIVYRRFADEKQEKTGDLNVNANFMAPLLINTQARIGFQKVLGKAERKITIKSD
ncbi:MAG: flagellar biosynthesis protein FliW [Sedimenticola selenatireducens]|uniref:Flagellar assembly factor FliW n=1 Tax=Sedimenticola selenatireducens TaxID=191960 RepID=A0A557SD19_9GAMM|nr:flagellar biosynthesis protein FliW [Sedimenticola selenatireducens]TVT66835.1 MAG: flagellar biosynthesis protein FliW [Sedimenticola selenatireducens]